MTLQEWIKDIIKRRDLTLRTAAPLVGVAHGTLSRINLGLSPDLDTFQKLAAWGNVNLGYLLTIAGFELGIPDSARECMELQNNPHLREIVTLAMTLDPTSLDQLVSYTRFLQYQPERA
jgi:transcriptional regulator with XRE-family HTH domain